jgi:virulence-associated protein VapD
MRRFFLPFLVLIIVLMLLSFGCAASSVQPGTVMPAAPPAPQGAPSKGGLNYDESYSENDAGSGIDRKIVKTGSITMVVDSISDTMPKITALANSLNGYVVSSNMYEGEIGLNGRMSIRVPASSYEDALKQLRGMAVKIPNENTNSQDVTEEYTDLQARLKNLEATEQQYLVLMEKAETVEDILKVQSALSSTREQIESIKARILYLERTSDMSLIEIILQESKSIQGKEWNALETIKSALGGLVTFGKALANILIWLLIFSPLWIIIIVVIFLVRRKRKKKKESKTST